MSQRMIEELGQYYKDERIEPVNSTGDLEEMFNSFGCPKKDCCKKICKNNYGDEDGFKFGVSTESPPISTHYIDRSYKGRRILRIVVVSLSPPMPYDEEDKGSDKLKQHWRETLALVRSLLKPYFDLEPARYIESENAKIIEQLFVHLRTSKCCSNANGSSEEHYKVYQNCGPYLKKEVSILRPDVVVTQGNNTNWQAGEHVFSENPEVSKVRGVSCSCAYIASLKECGQIVYWMRMYHPRGPGYYYPQTGDKIRPECDVVGAHRENLIKYGRDIERFMTDTCRWEG